MGRLFGCFSPRQAPAARDAETAHPAASPASALRLKVLAGQSGSQPGSPLRSKGEAGVLRADAKAAGQSKLPLPLVRESDDGLVVPPGEAWKLAPVREEVRSLSGWACPRQLGMAPRGRVHVGPCLAREGCCGIVIAPEACALASSCPPPP